MKKNTAQQIEMVKSKTMGQRITTGEKTGVIIDVSPVAKYGFYYTIRTDDGQTNTIYPLMEFSHKV